MTEFYGVFSARRMLCVCATLQKIKAKAGKKSSETLGKGSTKTVWKAEMKGFQ